MKESHLPKTGVMLFLAGCVALMGIITAEIFYPGEYGYTTREREISDLGSTRPPESLITQPSATIFNSSMIVTGVLILVGGYFLWKEAFDKRVLLGVLLLGLGILGVGIFPGNVAVAHPLMAMVTFLTGGVVAILSGVRVVSSFRQVALILGVLSLTFWFFAGSFVPVLGLGGTERWVAYPILLWLVGFGGYLMGQANAKKG